MHFGHQLLARPNPLAVGLPPLGLGAIVRHEPIVVAASERATEGAGPAAGPAPISPPWRCAPPWRCVPPWRCSLLLLPDDPAGHQPTPLSCHPYTRPRPSLLRPWPPWPWHRPPRPARPGRERAKRPAWPPPASPPASSTSSSFLLPLTRKFVSRRRRALLHKELASYQELSLSYYDLVVPD